MRIKAESEKYCLLMVSYLVQRTCSTE